MTYRGPLFFMVGKELTVLTDAFNLLTNEQLALFAKWSIRTEKDVLTLLKEGKFMAEQYGDTKEVMLEGTLPNCNLYGCILPDGSTHT